MVQKYRDEPEIQNLNEYSRQYKKIYLFYYVYSTFEFNFAIPKRINMPKKAISAVYSFDKQIR